MMDQDESVSLRVAQVSVRFGGNEVLKGVDLALRPGFTGLIGPNGAGKTTLFNVIGGYVKPTSGDVLLRGQRLTGRRPTDVARAGVGRTFQTPRLVPDMTILENVLLGVDGHRGLRGRSAWVRAMSLLDSFELSVAASTSASSLPLSSQKVVEVVRALMGKPHVLLLDEPAAGLAAEDVERLIPPLVEMAGVDGLTVLIIEHDIDLVSRLCSQVAVLHFGVTLAVGSPVEVLSLPDVVNAYLGAGFATQNP
jgi:branched-chain amino acid transport system ATP-binding protein